MQANAVIVSSSHNSTGVANMLTFRSLRTSQRKSAGAMFAVTEPGSGTHCGISFIGTTSESKLFKQIPNALAVLRAAAEIEPEPAEVMRWYRTIPILTLSHCTAQELVALGRAEEVITFLRAVRDDPFG